MTPRERYQFDLERADFFADPAQHQAVDFTQALYEQLVRDKGNGSGVFAQLKKIYKGARKAPIRGLYLWGGVGRGKTYVMNTFFDCLSFPEKERVHFHRFMQSIHHELRLIRDREKPLCLVADKIAANARVLCFDELHVTDITDAMLLGGLLQALFERGVTLVTTSNDAPDQLYHGGLQRDRFMPAIELIKKHTQIVRMDSGIDYRLRFLEHAGIYHDTLDQGAEEMLEESFMHFATNTTIERTPLDIEGRDIQTVCYAQGVAWFDFSHLCDGPRGPADYIEIARQYQTVLLANIPRMTDSDNDQAKRFITLVDEFYDRNVKLIVTAAAEPGQLYSGQRHALEFRRTASRLMEMRTKDYLAKPHLS